MEALHMLGLPQSYSPSTLPYISSHEDFTATPEQHSAVSPYVLTVSFSIYLSMASLVIAKPGLSSPWFDFEINPGIIRPYLIHSVSPKPDVKNKTPMLSLSHPLQIFII